MTGNGESHDQMQQHLHTIMAKKVLIPELKRTTSCPPPPQPQPLYQSHSMSQSMLMTPTITAPHTPPCDLVLVKVVFPSLDCTKLLRLNSHSVNYGPLVKILTIAKIDEEEKKLFRLYTEDGLLVRNGDSLLARNIKEKDTLLFKRKEDNGLHASSSMSNLLQPRPDLDSNTSSNSSIRPVSPNTIASPRSLTVSNLNASNAEHWGPVSSFLGSFLRSNSSRRPTMTDLPRHVFEMLDVPLPLRSYVVITCISYLKENEAHLMEGIFRLSGLATEVRTVCESFKSETFDLEWVKNPHTVATALKQYCRYATPPIIPSAVTIPWMNLLRASATEHEILEGVAQGLGALPPENKFSLVRLLSFIKLILDNQDINKMAAHNLSVVWGPNLINFQQTSMDAFSEANMQVTLMNLILTNFEHLRLWENDEDANGY